jgi:hypothetical protein
VGVGPGLAKTDTSITESRGILSSNHILGIDHGSWMRAGLPTMPSRGGMRKVGVPRKYRTRELAGKFLELLKVNAASQ